MRSSTLRRIMPPTPDAVSAALKTATSFVLTAVEVLRFSGLQADEEPSGAGGVERGRRETISNGTRVLEVYAGTAADVVLAKLSTSKLCARPPTARHVRSAARRGRSRLRRDPHRPRRLRRSQ